MLMRKWGKKYLILAIFIGKRFISRILVRTILADPSQAQDKVLGDAVYTKNVPFTVMHNLNDRI